MKRRSFPLGLTAAILLGLLAAGGGCATKTSGMKKLPRPLPPVAGADEILRSQQVDARASQLLKSGKAKSYSEAHKTAEKDFPAPADPSSATWSAEYAQWEKQKAEREKFEADFAKSLRSR